MIISEIKITITLDHYHSCYFNVRDNDILNDNVKYSSNGAMTMTKAIMEVTTIVH